MTYDNIKSHKNNRLYPLLEKHSFEKNIGRGQIDSPPAFSGLKDALAWSLIVFQGLLWSIHYGLFPLSSLLSVQIVTSRIVP